MPVSPISPRFVAILIALTALGPFVQQAFLPALPAIQQGFGVDSGVAQLTVSLAMLASGVATIFIGPLSDRYGRMPVVWAGLAIFLGASIVCALAENIYLLVGARLAQAVGASSGMVLTRAMARDAYGPDRSLKIMGYVITAMVVAPMLAPAIGGILVDAFGWRALFWLMTALGLIMPLAVAFGLRETNHNRLKGGWRAFAAGAAVLVRHGRFRAYVAISAMAMSLFFVFVTAVPYLMVETLGRTAKEYGLWFMGVSFVFMLGSLTSTRLVGRLGPDRLIAGGVLGAGCCVALGALWYRLVPLSPLVLFLPAYAIAFFQGWISTNAMGSAVNLAPHMAGTVSGLMGFLQMAVAAVLAQTVGMLGNGTVWPMIGVMAFCSGVAALALPFLRRPASALPRPAP